MGRLFYSAEELLKRPLFPGMHDQTHLYFHFRPARPANLVVTRDSLSSELNLAAGTYGLLTERPYTICLHSHKHSFDTTRNLQMIGTECVVALPGRDLVAETWFTALPVPRGIFEGDLCGFTLLPSRTISVPGIAECPVNLECKVEFVKDWYSHYAIFLRVTGASLDQELFDRDRLAVISEIPTYEVDDQTNAFGGSIERLGVNGELLECPAFPVGARHSRASAADWIEDLRKARILADTEFARLNGWLVEWQKQPGPEVLRFRLTRAFELAGWEEWDRLHEYLAAEGG
jgi:flavin reductase (DIM6/NTAB) family NADH-FMN oxidoreductase RutF